MKNKGLLLALLTVIGMGTQVSAQARDWGWGNQNHGWNGHDNGLHRGWFRHDRDNDWRDHRWTSNNNNDWRWRNSWQNNNNWRNHRTWYGSRSTHRWY